MLLLLAPLLCPALLHAADDGKALVQGFQAAVARWDMQRTGAILEELRRHVRDPKLLADFEAMHAYLSGDYKATLAILSKHGQSAFAKEMLERMKKLEPYFSKFSEHRRGMFVLRFASPKDEVLLDYCVPVLEKALEVNSKALGVDVRTPIIVEFYPSLESLHLASTLPLEDIERTGAVAVCIFNRIVIATPRIYLQGFHWADTLAHELTHYLIMKKTGQDVPVWLHEGIAKWQEAKWRNEKRDRGLCPTSASLLARAVRSDALVPFSKMHPSIAKLKDQEEAALAYAECVTFVEYFVRGAKSRRPLAELLDAIGSGKSVEAAFQTVTGAPFDDIKSAWLSDLQRSPPRGLPGLVFQPLKLAGGRADAAREEEIDAGMVEEARKLTQIGDLLNKSQRFKAAIIEYEKAEEKVQGLIPALSLRLAKARIQITEYESAASVLDALLRYYPDCVPALKWRGVAAAKMRDYDRAVRELENALFINPFDPETHLHLSNVYAQIGREGDARAERGRAHQLARTVIEQ